MISRDTLSLGDMWSKETASAITQRFREVSSAFSDVYNTPYGHAYADNLGQSITISATGTPVDLYGFTADQENGVIFQNDREFKILVPGHYLIIYTIAFKPASATQSFETAIAYNGTWQSNSTNNIVGGSGGAEVTVSGHTLLVIQVNDLIKLQIQNLTSISNITLEHANFSVIRMHF